MFLRYIIYQRAPKLYFLIVKLGWEGGRCLEKGMCRGVVAGFRIDVGFAGPRHVGFIGGIYRF